MLRVVTILVSFLIAVGARNAVLRQPRPELPPVRSEIPPEYMRIASLSYDALAADVIWIRFLQQLPMRPADDVLGRNLAAQLQTVVELDPDFREAHLEGGTLLSVLGNQHCAALDITERGMKRFPKDWRLAFQAGYICFSELHDSSCAARNMRAAADHPNAPQWLPRLVGRLLVEDSQVDAAIEYLAERAQRETDPRVKAHVEERLREAVLTRELRRLEEAVRAYRLREGSIPVDWDAVIAAGLLHEAPRQDPFGGTIVIGPDGRVRSTSGHSGLKAFRVEDGYQHTPREKITDLRVMGRFERVFGKPIASFGADERLRAMAGDPTVALAALEVIRELDPEQSSTIVLLEGRILLRREIEELREAYLRLLARAPDRKPAIDEIAHVAGLVPHDSFGDAYTFDAAGQPAPAMGREPVSVFRGPLARGSTACR